MIRYIYEGFDFYEIEEFFGILVYFEEEDYIFIDKGMIVFD